MKLLPVLALALFSLSARAASIGDCEGLDSIGNLIGQTKSFAENNVKVAYISTEEPASSPDHLLIFVYGEEMSVTCASVNAGEEKHGFGYINMAKLTSSYDRAKGLLITFPGSVWTGEDGKYRDELVKVRIDRSGSEPKITLE
jgi:hypothetical protein